MFTVFTSMRGRSIRSSNASPVSVPVEPLLISEYCQGAVAPKLELALIYVKIDKILIRTDI